MRIPCPTCNPCLDPTDPFQNFSAEAPDVNHVFCYGSGNGSLYPPAGTNWNVGNCTITWGPVSCYATNEGDCEACTQSFHWLCQPDEYLPNGQSPHYPFDPDWPEDHPDGGDDVSPIIGEDPDNPDDPLYPPVPRRVYWNGPQTAYYACADGSFQQFTVPGHQFAGWSQEEADRKAASYATAQIRRRFICLGPLSRTECCINQPYQGQVRASGNTVRTQYNLWSIVSGALPDGIELIPTGGPTVILSGSPTESGTFNFVLRIQNLLGDSSQRAFQLCVLDIFPATLPDGTVGTAYNETLTAPACGTAPLSWQVFSGALPDGLLLDEETGVISGTPTVDGTFTFMIVLQTQAT